MTQHDVVLTYGFLTLLGLVTGFVYCCACAWIDSRKPNRRRVPLAYRF